MPKAKPNKPQAIDFNEYLARLMTLKGNALRQHNRESTRRSNMLQKEILEANNANIGKYLRTPGAKRSLAEHKNHSGKITLSWRIGMEPGECRLRVNIGKHGGELALAAGHPVLE